METIKEWQCEWFYITESLITGQAEVPAFWAGPPTKLISWKKKGLACGNPTEVTTLSVKIKFWTDTKKVELVDVVNVMLHRRILSLQSRAKPMWAYNPEDKATLHHFFRSSPAGMWTQLFKPSKNKFPLEGGDLGFEAAHDAPKTWIPKAQNMQCPAPLPEGKRSHELTALLAVDPHVAPPKEPKPPKGRAGLRGRETSVTQSEETHASSTHDSDDEEDMGEGGRTLFHGEEGGLRGDRGGPSAEGPEEAAQGLRPSRRQACHAEEDNLPRRIRR